MSEVEATVETVPGTANNVHIDRVLAAAAAEVSTVGDRFYELQYGIAPVSESAEKDEREEKEVRLARFEQAMTARNRTRVFAYPTGGALLPLDVAAVGDEQPRFTRAGRFSAGDVGPFQSNAAAAEADGAFNATASAFLALLASRQYAARAANQYPMTFFVGPVGGRVDAMAAARAERGESEYLSRYNRVAFLSSAALGGGRVRWSAIAVMPTTSTREPNITAWANLPEEAEEAELDRLRRAVGADVVATWTNTVHPRVLQADGIFKRRGWGNATDGSILSEAMLRGGNPDFVRGTNSTQMHSVLWPLAQLSMTRDTSLFFDPAVLYTQQVAGETVAKTHPWYRALAQLDRTPEAPDHDPRTHAWFLWTMAMLSRGTLPYLRHTQSAAPRSADRVAYAPVHPRPHLTRADMDVLTRAVHKTLAVRGSA